MRTEVLGEKGVLFLDEDHKENILYTEEGFPHATADQARQTLEVPSAIDRSARTGEAVSLPLEEGI